MRRVDGANGSTDISLRDAVAGISCDDVLAYAQELEATVTPPSTSNACH